MLIVALLRNPPLPGWKYFGGFFIVCCEYQVVKYTIHKLLVHKKPHLSLIEKTSHCQEILDLKVDSVVSTVTHVAKAKSVCDYM